MQASPLLSLSPSSPSFSNYSSANLAEIAARVVEEFRKESVDSSIFDWESEDFYSQDKNENNICSNHHHDENNNNNIKEEEDEVDDEEFEFAFVADSTISADEIFCNGQIKPIYPLFNTDLIFNNTQYESSTHNTDHNNNNESSSSKTRSRSPLGRLMNEERETTSSSSSEADDLDNLQPGTYCVWTPKASVQESPGTCKKSNSTGSSKRWKFRDLLYRSNSDGTDKFVFLTPSNNKQKTEKLAEESKDKGKVKASEANCATRNNRPIKEDDKRKPFLPYRQDLVGFFNNINGLNRNLHPF